MPAPRGFEMYRIDADTITLVLLDQLVACVSKLKWADTNDIARVEFSGSNDTLGIDIHTIRTAQINNAIATIVLTFQPRMITRDLGIFQYDCIIAKTPNRYDRCI